MHKKVNKHHYVDGRHNETADQSLKDEVKRLKQQVAELEKEHFMFQGLLETIPDLIYFKDRESRFTRISKAMEHRFKYRNKIDNVLGKTDFDMYSEEHARQAYDDEQNIMGSGESMINKEEKETWEDGSVTWASSTKVPLYDKNKDIIGIVGISRDITERKENEAKLKEYRENLEAAKEETDNILANVDEGLFLLDKSLKLGSQYSKELESILFETKLSARPLINILKNKISEKDLDSVNRFLNLLFEEQQDGDMLQELNPLVKTLAQIDGLEKYLTFKFKRIFNKNGNISHLITTVNDVTREVMLSKSLEESRAENKRKMDWMISILNVDPMLLNDFINSAEQELKNAAAGLNDLEDNPSKSEFLDLIYRSVHTIKGNASLLDLDFFAETAHKAENDLSQLKEHQSDREENLNRFKNNFFLLKKIFEELKSLINQISGIHNQFRPRRNQEHKMLIHSLEKLAKRLCGEADKNITLTFKGFDDNHIPYEYKLMIRDILVQMVRNSIIHGIEPSKERLSKGKTESGNIWISVDSDDARFKMTFKDDGQGLNLEALKTKALGSKKWTQTEIDRMNAQQIGEIIFEPGISTVESTDLNAGRGVGMDIIRKKIEEAGGMITFETKTDSFTSFSIELPLKKQEN
ncbi:MAG: PAS domain S-box protein [Calditrichaceae bacterium]|nr:PAS domain S-box protein [Calditrichaceae bacterium]MBN2710200.1 PAS domain S-box protein [Calditrichaceae bacterium]RQV94174.1 MAG: PAS domain S-box protein [Calditrichota bacterium]